MPVSALQLAANVAIVAQIAVPLLLAWPAWRIEDPATTAPERDGSRPRRGPRRRAEISTLAGPARAALVCTACQAPVPLLASSFACPFCGSPTTAPPEYAGALAAAAQAGQHLARAERAWRWSRVWTSLLFVWSGRLAVVAWLVVVVGAAVELIDAWPKALLALACIIAVAQTFFGLALFAAMRDLRRAIPPLPARAELTAPPESGQCAGCMSPVAFAADRFSLVCGYCTAVQYRRALAHAAHAGAQGAEVAAERSLLDGLRALEMKRFELAGAVAITGIAVVFYAVIFGLSVVAEMVGF